MQPDDQSYYLRRAEAEIALAQCAVHPSAVRAHYHLAGHYLDRAHGAGHGGRKRPRHDNVVAEPLAQPAPPDSGFVTLGR